MYQSWSIWICPSVCPFVCAYVRACGFMWLYFPLNRRPQQLLILKLHKLYDVEDAGQQHFVVKRKLQINYFHVNASPPESLAVATSTFAAV